MRGLALICPQVMDGLHPEQHIVLSHDGGPIEAATGRWEFTGVKEALEAAGSSAEFGEVTMRPENIIELAGDEAVRMQKLLDALEALDDVQDVYSSAELGD